MYPFRNILQNEQYHLFSNKRKSEISIQEMIQRMIFSKSSIVDMDKREIHFCLCIINAN